MNMKNYTNLLRISIIIATVVAIAVITIGVLAIPIVMALFFSYYWLLLYIAYLFVVIYVAAACMDNQAGGTHK